MTKPISLATTSVTLNHPSEWEMLRTQANSNPEFDALEVKAFYVYGLIYDICQSVQALANQSNFMPDLYMPAYAILASGIELLGRCLQGDANESRTAGQNTRTGFHFLVNQSPSDPPAPTSVIVVTTRGHSYSITDLVALRNFTAHGQAANRRLPAVIEPELLINFPQLIGDAMEIYWHRLLTEVSYCEKLGTANVRPIPNRSAPIEKILRFFDEGSAGAPFYGFDWRVR
jgi:hypothetical protein